MNRSIGTKIFRSKQKALGTAFPAAVGSTDAGPAAGSIASSSTAAGAAATGSQREVHHSSVYL